MSDILELVPAFQDAPSVKQTGNLAPSLPVEGKRAWVSVTNFSNLTNRETQKSLPKEIIGSFATRLCLGDEPNIFHSLPPPPPPTRREIARSRANNALK